MNFKEGFFLIQDYKQTGVWQRTELLCVKKPQDKPTIDS